MDAKYKAYLKSDEWKERREFIIDIHWNKCQKCKSKYDLQVHHASYENLYNESLLDLCVLCRECHESYHEQFWTTDLKKNTFIYINGQEKYDKKQNMLKRLQEKIAEWERLWIKRPEPEHDDKFWHNNPVWLKKEDNKIWIWNILKQYQEYRHWDDPIKYPIPDSDDLNIALDATIKFMLDI